MIAGKFIIFLAAFILIPPALSQNNPKEFGSEIMGENGLPFALNKEVKGYIKNIIDAYRKELNLQVTEGLDTPQDQDKQYKMLKRNADIVNTLLGFPRRMLLAGR